MFAKKKRPNHIGTGSAENRIVTSNNCTNWAIDRPSNHRKRRINTPKQPTAGVNNASASAIVDAKPIRRDANAPWIVAQGCATIPQPAKRRDIQSPSVGERTKVAQNKPLSTAETFYLQVSFECNFYEIYFIYSIAQVSFTIHDTYSCQKNKSIYVQFDHRHRVTILIRLQCLCWNRMHNTQQRQDCSSTISINSRQSELWNMMFL